MSRKACVILDCHTCFAGSQMTIVRLFELSNGRSRIYGINTSPMGVVDKGSELRNLLA